MKRIAALASILVLVGCTSVTDFGPCIGAFDDKDPKLTYKMSAWNVFLGVILVETLIVPMWVVINETLCPVGKKSTTDS